jgi:hypothetical protein
MIENVKFNRNPKFTPRLSDEYLDAIEQIARQVVGHMVSRGYEMRRFDDLDLSSYLNPDFCMAQGIDSHWFESDLAWNYLRSSCNYLLTIAINKGWMKRESAIKDRRTWAVLRGY